MKFHGFLATTSSKISSGTKLGLRSNSANATLSCDLLLIYVVSLIMLNTNFSNKTQLKIKIKIEFFLLGRTLSGHEQWSQSSLSRSYEKGRSGLKLLLANLFFNINYTGSYK